MYHKTFSVAFITDLEVKLVNLSANVSKNQYIIKI